MSATARLLGCCVALGATLSVLSVLAGPHQLAGSTHVSWMALGQTEQSSSADARRVAETWLRQAREAMKNGQLDLAEYYIERAEKLNVSDDPLFARFKDSPAKARQDLAEMRAKAGTAPAASGNPLTRLFNRDKGGTPPADPYGAAGDVHPLATSGNLSEPAGQGDLVRLPDTGPSATGAAPLAGGAMDERHARSRDLLLAARQALAKGDAQRAGVLVAQAKQLGLTYPLNADSPARVDALVRNAGAFAQGPQPGTDPAAYTRDFAQFLMDQATGLMAYQALDDAQKLAQAAKDLSASYGQFDRTPEQVLGQIAALRRQVTGPEGELAAGSRVNLSDTSPLAPRRLPSPDGALADPKSEALRMVAESRAALMRGDLQTAKLLAEQAQGLVPESAYGPDDVRPWMVMLEIDKAMKDRGGAVMPAANFESQNAVATDDPRGGSYPVSQGIYDPANDASRNMAAQALQPTPAVPNGASPGQNQPASEGERFYQEGLRALENHDRQTAMQLFRSAWQYERELDPQTRQQLQDKLILLQANTTPPPGQAGTEPTPLEAVDAKQQLLRQKLYREITSEQAEAQRMSQSDPRGALVRLEKLRERINATEVDPTSKKQLLTLVDRSVDSLQQYIEMNKSDIDLAERNQAVVDGLKLDAQREQEIQNKLASLVEEFNQLLDDQRYAEAEQIAKQAKELAPDAEVVQNLLWQSRFVRRMQEQMAIDDKKESGFYGAMTAVQDSSAPMDDRQPYLFGDARDWSDMTRNRLKLLERHGSTRSKAEMEIERALSNKVDVKFTDRPLSEVMDMLSELSGVPIVLDTVGLASEGVTSDIPVTLRLQGQISLRSALNLILSELRLSYVINNEVLRITSETTRNTQTYVHVYNVADLVIPIPNFIPGYNTGLAGALKYAHDSLGYGNGAMPMGRVPLSFASNDLGAPNSNTSVLAQMGAGGLIPSLSSQPQTPSYGPGGMGGAAYADFDTLIELITSTIAPDTWDEVGGAGAIESFPTNLSLVISQTQEVHEQIQDLMDQLRRLQDLQVTIEVRFITLNDSFFERIGIDFDFTIDDNVNVDLIRGSERAGGLGDDTGPSAIFGINENGPTTTLDLEFTQGSFGSTLPQFGGFDANSAANFGFAILSDLEVFFLLQAAEGDQRTNVLQAPKVTLFNGQTASVSDQSQQPFVTSIIPVVGDFAAAQQPVIVVLSEGTQLTVQAVVSSDRRFVRLTLVPFFSRIGPVEEFTFEGRTSTDTGTIVTDPETGEETGRDNEIVDREGTTVQLPTFIFTSVSTTVSVPDGGTVLLGGIKRLSEGRVERGVPMLSKMPYVNRLFKNVGIGRETESLMMMVTPRIIIQEEEELQQTGYDSSQ